MVRLLLTDLKVVILSQINSKEHFTYCVVFKPEMGFVKPILKIALLGGFSIYGVRANTPQTIHRARQELGIGCVLRR